MTTADRLKTIADNVSKVYEAGKQSQYDESWDILQGNGRRTSYRFAYFNWSCEYIRPKYKHGSVDGMQYIFAANTKLLKVEKDFFDFSNIPNGYNANYAFFNCTSLLEIEDVGIPALPSYGDAFRGCNSLHTIEILRVSETTTFSNTLTNCNALENLTIEGVVGQNSFNVQSSTKLTHDSLMSIINALRDNSGTSTWNTIVLGAGNLAKLSAEELYIMERKQWEYS